MPRVSQARNKTLNSGAIGVARSKEQCDVFRRDSFVGEKRALSPNVL